MRASRKRRFSIRTKLLLISLILLGLPWLGHHSLREMQDFLLRGQEQAQALAARAIATALHERDDLFHPLLGIPKHGRSEDVFYAYPLIDYIQIDGYSSDWAELLDHAVGIGKRHTAQPAKTGSASVTGSSVVFGVRDEFLYGFLTVEDDQIVYRHPSYHRFDSSDHIRLSLLGPQGRIRRIVLSTEAPGALTSDVVTADWRLPLNDHPLAGIVGHWHALQDQYAVEFRLPLAMLGPDQRIHIAVADVDDVVARTVKSVVGSLGPTPEDGLNPMVIRSPELQRILRGLGRSEAAIWIVDHGGRVLAHVQNRSFGSEQHVEQDTHIRDEKSVRQALSGTAGIERRTQGESVVIMATHPIHFGDTARGAVVVEQTTEKILALQRKTLEKIAVVTLATLAVIITGLVVFSSRLAFRIRRLSVQAGRAIAPSGRVRNSVAFADRNARDELGDLSRSMVTLLQRLARYTHFLESIPRLLRHEITNPLNTISTSLQNLSNELPAGTNSPYMSRAERGIARISSIMHRLTEAASLEEALRNEEQQVFDLATLTRTYIDNCRMQHPNRRFAFECQEQSIPIAGNDLRIQQLLDKLIDNAVDFSAEEGLILIEASVTGTRVSLSVSNEGPPLPEHIREQLFDSMVSGRDQGRSPTPHLGVGLYVARVIAEHHGGTVQAANRTDKPGAVFTVRLPLAAQAA